MSKSHTVSGLQQAMGLCVYGFHFGFILCFKSSEHVCVQQPCVLCVSVEDAGLPEGKEGCRLLPEPGRPHAVLQVRVYVSLAFPSDCDSKYLFGIAQLLDRQ